MKESLKVAFKTEKITGSRLLWYGHVMRRKQDHIPKQVPIQHECEWDLW